MESRTKNIGEQARDAAQSVADRAKDIGSAAWEKTKMGYASAQEKAMAGAKATDRVIRTNPYKSIGIAFGIGLLLGFLIKRKRD